MKGQVRTQSFILHTSKSKRKSYQAKRIVFNYKISGLNNELCVKNCRHLQHPASYHLIPQTFLELFQNCIFDWVTFD